MKVLKTTAALAILSLLHLQSGAQNATPPLNQPDYNKPKIFSDLPDKLTLHITDMEALLTVAVGSPVTTSIANGFLLSGTVVSKSNPSDTSVKTIVIKCLGRQSAIVTFTRISKPDGSISYKGRIISRTSGDAFEIAKEGNSYVLLKKGFYDLINE